MKPLRTGCGVLFLGFVLFLLGMRLTASYRHRKEFESKRAFFEKIIAEVEAKDLPISNDIKIPIPAGASDLVYAIWAERVSKDQLAVVFFTGKGFPVKHRAFVYMSKGDITDYPFTASFWPKRWPLQKHWCYVGD